MTAVFSALDHLRTTTAEVHQWRETIQRPHPPVFVLFKNRPSNCTVKWVCGAKQELNESLCRSGLCDVVGMMSIGGVFYMTDLIGRKNSFRTSLPCWSNLFHYLLAVSFVIERKRLLLSDKLLKCRVNFCILVSIKWGAGSRICDMKTLHSHSDELHAIGLVKSENLWTSLTQLYSGARTRTDSTYPCHSRLQCFLS